MKLQLVTNEYMETLRDKNEPISKKREEYLDTIVEKIDQIGRNIEEYYNEPTNQVAEYVENFFDGEADKDEIINQIKYCIDEFEDISSRESKRIYNRLNRYKNLRELTNDICQYTDIEFTTSSRSDKHVLLSRLINKTEDLLPDDILEILYDLTKKEIEYINTNMDYEISNNHLRIDHADNMWALNIDIEKLINDWTR
jgi:hypothetical protein